MYIQILLPEHQQRRLIYWTDDSRNNCYAGIISGSLGYFDSITGINFYEVNATITQLTALVVTGSSAFFDTITGTKIYTNMVEIDQLTGSSAYFDSVTGVLLLSALQLTGQSAYFDVITGSNISALITTGNSAVLNAITGYSVYAGSLSTLQLTGQSAFFTTITGYGAIPVPECLTIIRTISILYYNHRLWVMPALSALLINRTISIFHFYHRIITYSVFCIFHNYNWN